MTDRRIVVLSEGPNEIGREREPIHAEDDLPALPCLVHRLLGAPPHVKYRSDKLREVAHVRHLDKKVMAAMEKARVEKADALAVVVDRDGPGRANRRRLSQLQAGRNALPATLGVPCAVGVAVEAFDAWMIADKEALSAAPGDGKPQAHADPESLGPGKAKEHAQGQLGRARSDKYAAIAAKIDLNLLKRKCPRGFKPFAQEVTDWIAPSFQDT